MPKPVMTNPWVQAVAVVAAFVCLCILCYILSPVLVPLLFAFLVAYILDPVVDAIELRGFSRNWVIAMIALVAIVILLVLPLFLIQNLLAGAQHLIQTGAEGLRGGAFYSLFEPLMQKLRPFVLEVLTYAGWIGPGDRTSDLSALISQRIGEYVQQNAVQIVSSYAFQFAGAGQWAGQTAAQIMSSAGRNLIAFLEFVASVAVFGVVAVYLLKDFDEIVASVKELIPPSRRTRVTAIVAKIDEQIHGFLRGQIVVCACLGVLYSIGLLIFGVPFAIPIGLIGGAASFVPYLGFALTSLPAVILVVLQHGIDWHVLGVAATFGIAQAIEGTFLTPKIVGDKVGLGPVWVILAIMVFSSLLGFLGLLLAVPMAAALKVLVLETLAYYRSSPLFASSDSGEVESGEGASVVEPKAPPGAGPAAGTARRPRKRITKSS